MVECCCCCRAAGGGCRPARLCAARLAGRPLLSLGVLQLLLGLGAVALSCGALSLSGSLAVRRACPLWAGASVMLSGIIGLTTWRRPILLLVNVFVLLSVVSVLLNLSAFILCCQGAQLVSSSNDCTLSELRDVCHCCSLSLTECPSEEVLVMVLRSAGSSCSSMKMLLKKVLFALSALNALSTAVCLVAAGLRYLQIFNSRPTWTAEESRVTVENGTDPEPIPDPDEFVAPAPPPSYFSMFYSYTPRLARRMLGDSAVVPQPSYGGFRMKGAELFPPSDPPPPYEEVAGGSAPNPASSTTTTVTQETELSTITCNTPVRGPVSDLCLQTVSETSGVSLPPTPPRRHQQAAPGGQQRAVASLHPQRAPQIRRSNSDPLLTEVTTKAVVVPEGPTHHGRVTADSATQTSQSTLSSQPHPHPPVAGWSPGILGRNQEEEEGVASVRLRPRQQRPSSMVDCQSYQPSQRPTHHRPSSMVHCQGYRPGPQRPTHQIPTHQIPSLQRPTLQRPSSMLDYQSYAHTQRLVSRFLEQQPACSAPYLQGLDPEVHRLVDSIRTVLQLDQQHMEEVLRSAQYLEQAFTESETTSSGAGGTGRDSRPITAGRGGVVPPPLPPPPPAQTLPLPPRRKAAGLLHLRSCGDLSSYTCSGEEGPGPPRRCPEPPRRARAPPRAPAPPERGSGVAAPPATLRRSSRRRDLQERPHSLIGIVRETIL